MAKEKSYEDILANIVSDFGLEKEFKFPFVSRAAAILQAARLPKPKEKVRKPWTEEDSKRIDGETEVACARWVRKYNLPFSAPFLKDASRIFDMVTICVLIEAKKFNANFDRLSDFEKNNLFLMIRFDLNPKDYGCPADFTKLMQDIRVKLLARQGLSQILTDERLYQIR